MPLITKNLTITQSEQEPVLDHKREVVSALTDGQDKANKMSMLNEVTRRLTMKEGKK